MPRFGKRSKERLRGVDSRLREVLEEVVKHYDITVIEGLRSAERQRKLFADGKSKLDGVTRKSNHQLGRAVDIAAYPIDFEATKDFYYLAGMMQMASKKLGYTIRWGGDWNQDQRFSGRTKRADKTQRFDDLVHFEIRG